LSGSGKQEFQVKTGSPVFHFSTAAILQTGFENTIFPGNLIAELSTDFLFNQQDFQIVAGSVAARIKVCKTQPGGVL